MERWYGCACSTATAKSSSPWKTSALASTTTMLSACSPSSTTVQAPRPAGASVWGSRSAAPSCCCIRAKHGPRNWLGAASRFVSHCRSRKHRVLRSPSDVTEARPTILVVEDEPEIRRFLRSSLGAEGYKVVESTNGRRGSIDASTHKPDLAIVDLGLPDFDGVEVIRRIRSWSPMPIVVLSARVQERTKVEALDAGADDYVTKPFGIGELLARVRAALRHTVRIASGKNILILEDAIIDLEARKATRGT